MKILKLDIMEFGGLTDRHYELCDGLNIFQGDNEAGKSTVWLFVKFMLYGMPKRGHPEREKAINRTTHMASGSMTVLWQGDIYTIERSFSEHARGRASVYKSGETGRMFEGQEPGEAMLGVPRDIFENSCGIGQSLCTGLGGERGAAAIKNILSSADESVDVEKIEKRLDKIRVEYRYKMGKGGKLYELSEQIAQLERRLDRATDSRLQIVDAEEKLEKNSAALAQNEAELAEVRGLLGQLQRLEIIRRFDALAKSRESLDELKKNRELLVSSELENENIPTAVNIANLSMLADSAERAQREEKAAEERYNGMDGRPTYDAELAAIGERIEQSGGKDSLLARLGRLRNGITAGIVLAVIAAALVGASAVLANVLGALSLALLAAGILACIAGVALFAVFYSKLRALSAQYGKKSARLASYILECSEHFAVKGSYDMKYAELKAELSAARTHREFAFSELEGALRRTSSTAEPTVDGARAEIERLNSFINRYEGLKNQIDRLSELIANDRRILSVYDENEVRNSLSKDISELDKINVKEIESKERFYSEKVRTLRERDNTLKTALINYKAVSEDPAVLADSIAELKKKYAAADDYCEAVMLAIEGLQRAAATLRGSITPVIGRNAGKMVDYISGGRYSSVNMGGDMNIALVDTYGRTTTGEMMSGGMKDAAYVALRISLMMQLYRDEMPPLMMDETLCQLDDTRMKRILELVDKLCEDGNQCLLFTCHRREAEACAELGIEANVYKM